MAEWSAAEDAGSETPEDDAAGAATRPRVEVAFDLPLPPLTYYVPERLTGVIEPGVLVEARLRGRHEIGCVLGAAAARDGAPLKRLLPISRRVTPDVVVPAALRDLAAWMSDYYLCAPGEALACVSFVGFRDLKPQTIRGWRLTDEGRRAATEEEGAPKATKRQRVVLLWIGAQDAPSGLTAGIPAGAIRDGAHTTDALLKGLARAGLLEEVALDAEPRDVSPAGATDLPPTPLTAPLDLRDAQRAALDAIAAALDAHAFGAFLLQGVTGSGKTEVYLQALARTLSQGRAGIVLVPEIALTPQTVGRFRSRFGSRVEVYHSRLTPHEKLRLHGRIRRGEVDVLVGARSALFAPFERLGLVVVDEEHEATYKQETAPRYNARDVALVRGRAAGAAVVLGSATPSLESAFNAETRKFSLLRLDDRINRAPLPAVEIVDMAGAARAGDVANHLSRALRLALAATLERREQALLLLNRRGYHAFFFCHSCRDSVRCPHCDVALTHHTRPPLLMCHLCGHRQGVDDACPVCGAETTRMGIGTERLEEELARLFPSARLLRLDTDTTGGKHDFDVTWAALEAGGVDIILGTQMIAKGLHLEGVTLVGVVLADLTLHQPDFRAAERTFALLTQVAGRAGRGDKPGRVLIQTYSPAHYSVRHATDHGFDAFYADEVRRRRAAGFPPFTRLVAITVSGPERRIVLAHAEAIGGELAVAERALGASRLAVFGPMPPSLARLKDLHRMRLLVRGPSMAPLRRAVREALAAADARGPAAWRRHRVIADVDPIDCA